MNLKEELQNIKPYTQPIYKRVWNKIGRMYENKLMNENNELWYPNGDIEKIKVKIRTKLKTTNKFSKEIKTIHFCKNINYPRDRFKTNYPEIKIKRDFKFSDCIVIDEYINIKECNSAMWFYDSPHNSGSSLYLYSQEQVNSLIYYTELADLSHKLIDVNSIPDTNEHIELTIEVIENVMLLLSSKTSDSLNLAFRMIQSFNYEENKFIIHYMLQMCSRNISNIYGQINKNVDIKLLLSKVNRDFGYNVRSYYNSVSIIKTCVSLLSTELKEDFKTLIMNQLNSELDEKVKIKEIIYEI